MKAFFAVCFLAAPVAFGQEVISYQGNWLAGVDAESGHSNPGLKAEITLSVPLAASLKDAAVSPISATFSWPKDPGTVNALFYFSTDSMGQITGWNIIASGMDESLSITSTGDALDLGTYSFLNNLPGTWTVVSSKAPAPPPGSTPQSMVAMAADPQR